MSGKIKVLVVDDHALVRKALSDRLRQESDLEVLQSVGNAGDAISEARRLAPHVILMDIDMPGQSCFDAARRIASICRETRILFLSGLIHDQFIEQALLLRAGGYVTKREPPEVIVTAIREVAGGGVYFSEDVRARIVVDERGVTLKNATKSRLSLLTPRELDVLRTVASGMSQRQIASSMGISVKTVDNHCTNLMNKLDIHDRVKLTRFAIREGLSQV